MCLISKTKTSLVEISTPAQSDQWEGWLSDWADEWRTDKVVSCTDENIARPNRNIFSSSGLLKATNVFSCSLTVVTHFLGNTRHKLWVHGGKSLLRQTTHFLLAVMSQLTCCSILLVPQALCHSSGPAWVAGWMCQGANWRKPWSLSSTCFSPKG